MIIVIMNSPLRLLFTNLDVIGNLTDGEKLFMRKDGYLGINSSNSAEHAIIKRYKGLMRWWTNESRETSWVYLKNIIQTSIDYLDIKREFSEQILIKLEKAKKGINCLKLTYKNEPSFVAKLDTLIININAVVKEY